jgi:hypothetical protein
MGASTEEAGGCREPGEAKRAKAAQTEIGSRDESKFGTRRVFIADWVL